MGSQPRLNPSAAAFVPTFGTGSDLVSGRSAAGANHKCSLYAAMKPETAPDVLAPTLIRMQASWAQGLSDKKKAPGPQPAGAATSKPQQSGAAGGELASATTPAVPLKAGSRSTSHAQPKPRPAPHASNGQASPRGTGSQPASGASSAGAGGRSTSSNGAARGAWGRQDRSRQDAFAAAPSAAAAAAPPAAAALLAAKPLLPVINTQPPKPTAAWQSAAPRGTAGEAANGAGGAGCKGQRRNGQRGGGGGGADVLQPASAHIAAVKTQPVVLHATVSCDAGARPCTCWHSCPRSCSQSCSRTTPACHACPARLECPARVAYFRIWCHTAISETGLASASLNQTFDWGHTNRLQTQAIRCLQGMAGRVPAPGGGESLSNSHTRCKC